MKTARKSVALSLGAAAVALSVAGAVTENTFAEGNQVTIPDQAFFNCLTNGGVTSNPGDNPVQVPVVDAANRIIDISHFSEYAYVNVKCSDKGITSIEGFQNLPFFDYETGGWSAYHGSVIMADFKNNKISDVSPITARGSMTYVYLDNNNISDISSFSNMNSLFYLSLANNKITSIEPLRNITDFRTLNISNNQISDISVLNNRTGITSLVASNNKLGGNTINVLSTLTGLETLNLYNTGISTLSFTANMPNLKTLNVSANNISDYSPLANKTNLEYLALSGNKSRNISVLTGLNNLKALYLSYLDLNDNDLQYLKNLTSLEALGLTGNQLTNISALSNLTSLTELNVALNNISDYSGVAPELTYKASHASRYYGQYLTMDAGTASSVELPASFSQVISGLKEYNWQYRIEVFGGECEYDEDTNIVTFKDDAESIRLRLTADLIYQNDPANPYYVEVEISRTIEDKGEDEKGQEKESDKKEQKNPNTKNGISAAAGIFGGMIAAMGALFTIKRTRR